MIKSGRRGPKRLYSDKQRRERDAARAKARYHSDPEYRQRKLDESGERWKKIKNADRERERYRTDLKYRELKKAQSRKRNAERGKNE